MSNLIDKSALVAEIDRLENKLYCEPENFKDVGAKMALDSLKSFLNTIEVKEVRKETESIWHDANELPTMYRKYLVRYSNGRVSGSWERHDDGFIPWKDVVKEHKFTHWCYTEDLLKL
jgi:hypothetical protein